MKKLKEIMKTIQKLLKVSQVHGIPKIFNSEKLRAKILWSLSFLISVSFFGALFLLTLKQYFSYPTVTNINLFRSDPIEFPAIKICLQYQRKGNYSLNDIVISCEFKSLQNCFNDSQLLTYEFDKKINKYCINFNSKRSQIVYAKRSGKHNGLRLQIFTGLFNETQVDPFNLSVSNGVQVVVYNQSVMPTTDEGIIVQPGVASFLAINKVIVQKLGEPYNDCIEDLSTYRPFDLTLYKEIVKFNTSYRQNDCLDWAFIRSLTYCNNSYIDIFGNCSSDLNLTNTIVTEFFDFYASEKYKNYLDNCPAECNSVSYDIRSSFGDYPSYSEYMNLLADSKFMENFNGSKPTLDDVKKSLILVYIYFENHQYTIISQQPQFSPADLISSIGGLLGLFMGFSVLSLIDLIEIMLEITFTLFKKNQTTISDN